MRLRAFIAFILSMLITLGAAYLAYSGFFGVIEQTLYNPRVAADITTNLETIARVSGDWHKKNLREAESYFSADSVKKAMLPQQNSQDIYERARLFGQLQERNTYVLGARIIATDGKRLHFSTFPGDILRTEAERIVYRNYDQEGDIPIEKLSLYTETNKLFVDTDANAIVYCFPYIDTFTVKSGVALLYVGITGLQAELSKQKIFPFGETVQPVAQGLVFGFPKALEYAQTLQEKIETYWNTRVSGEFIPIGQTENSETFVLTTIIGEELYYGRIVPASWFQFPPALKLLLICIFFSLTYLLLFFIFISKRDPVLVITQRIKKIQIDLIKEYITEGLPVKERIREEFERRRQEVKSRIQQGLGKVNKKQLAELDTFIDKGWDEIIEIFTRLHGDTKQADLSGIEAMLKEMLERWSHEQQALRIYDSSVSPVSVHVSGPVQQKASEASAPQYNENQAAPATLLTAGEAEPAVATRGTLLPAQALESAEPAEPARGMSESAEQAWEVEELEELSEAEETPETIAAAPAVQAVQTEVESPAAATLLAAGEAEPAVATRGTLLPAQALESAEPAEPARGMSESAEQAWEVEELEELSEAEETPETIAAAQEELREVEEAETIEQMSAQEVQEEIQQLMQETGYIFFENDDDEIPTIPEHVGLEILEELNKEYIEQFALVDSGSSQQLEELEPIEDDGLIIEEPEDQTGVVAQAKTEAETKPVVPALEEENQEYTPDYFGASSSTKFERLEITSPFASLRKEIIEEEVLGDKDLQRKIHQKSAEQEKVKHEIDEMLGEIEFELFLDSFDLSSLKNYNDEEGFLEIDEKEIRSILEDSGIEIIEAESSPSLREISMLSDEEREMLEELQLADIHDTSDPVPAEPIEFIEQYIRRCLPSYNITDYIEGELEIINEDITRNDNVNVNSNEIITEQDGVFSLNRGAISHHVKLDASLKKLADDVLRKK